MFTRFGFGTSLLLLLTSSSQADIIQLNEIVGTETLVNSGNGALDLRLMTFSGSEIDNASGSFNGDNGNNTLPQGGGSDTLSFAESYLTTVLEVKDFYRLNFPDGNGGSTVDEIVLFIDLNETGNGQPINSLDKIDLVLSPASILGSPSPNLDVTSAQQAAINQVYTGGTLIANLFSSLIVVPINAQGAGHADYAIFTGVNPFTLNDGDGLLFNISMSVLNNGSEEVFLSGEFARATSIPEPSARLLICCFGSLVIVARERRNKLESEKERMDMHCTNRCTASL